MPHSHAAPIDRAGDALPLVPLALFALASLQAAFLTPYVVLVQGERTNLLTPLLVCLPALWLAAAHRAGLDWRAARPWIVLGLGLCFSGFLSITPQPAVLRALSFFCPAAAGLFCARTLPHGESALALLTGLLTFCFAGLTATHLAFGAQPSFMGLHHHALAGVLILLAAGPIRLAVNGAGLRRAAALLLLAAGALVCFLAGSRFVILLPFVLVPALLFLGRLKLRHALLVLGASAAVAAAFFAAYPGKVMRVAGYESTYYRVEGPAAAWEIVKKRPLVGIGLRTPRRGYLEEFDPPFGTASREEFLRVVDVNVSWDNQWLTMFTGVGAPLTLLYLALLGGLLARCLARMRRGGLDPGLEQGLIFALLATLIHQFIHDGLLYPQINWFFHVLLGVGAYPGPGPGAPLPSDPPQR